MSLTQSFQERIILILSEYLKDLTTKNISRLSVGMLSELTLDNLEIREDLLLMNSIPLIINEGRINKAQITIPALYNSTPARIEFEDVMIRVRLLVEHRSSNTNEQARDIGVESFKEKKLKSWESKIRKHFRELSAPSYVKKVIDNILKNMIISIKNINIYYESISLLSSPSLAKLSIKELSVHTTDQNWIPGFNSDRKTEYREVSIIGLSITLNVNKSEAASNVANWFESDKATKQFRSGPSKTVINLTKSENNYKPENNNYKRSRTELLFQPMKRVQTNTQEVEFEYRKLRENDVYLLFPLDLTVRVKKHLDLSQDFDVDAKLLFWIEVKDAIILMLNKDHMRFIMALSNHFKSMSIVQKNLHLRPTQPPRVQAKEWFIYAIRATLEDLKRERVSDFLKNPASLHKMKKYIDLYKRQQTIIDVPWLPKISDKERPLLKTFEEEIPLDNLLQFRKWAFIEIRIEAKRFANSNKDAHGIKPLLDIWYHTLNNSDVFMEAKTDFCETIRLSSSEQNDLYEILVQDKSSVLESYLKGEKHDPKDIDMKLVLHVRSFYLMITETKKYHQEKFHITNRPKNCEVRKWWDQSHPHFTQSVQNPARPPNSRGVSSPTGITEKSRLLPGTPERITPNAPTDTKGLNIETPKANSDHFTARISLNTNETQKSESFQKHLMDVEKDAGSNFLLDENESDHDGDIGRERLESGHFEFAKSSTYWWNQNLLLLIEVLQINASINKYRSGKTMTDKEKPLKVGSIMVTTALNLPEATRQRKVNKDDEGQLLSYEHLLHSILIYDFSSIPMNTDQDRNPLIRFLKEEGFLSFASFLEIFSRNRHGGHGQGVQSTSIRSFAPFFDPKSHFYINEFSTALKSEFTNYLKGDVNVKTPKEKLLQDAFEELEAYISKYLLPSFLFSYGVLVLPLLIHTNAENLLEGEAVGGGGPSTTTIVDIKKLGEIWKKLKEVPAILQDYFVKDNSNKKKDQSSQEHTALSVKFLLEGKESKFQIKRIDLPQSASERKRLQKAFTFDNMPKSGEEPSFIDLKATPIVCYLSTESFKPLALFFSSLSSKSQGESDLVISSPEGSDTLPVRDYETLMECIHSRDSKEEPVVADNTRIDADFQSISIILNDPNSNYINKRQLSINFNNILFTVKQASMLDILTPRGTNPQGCYNKKYLQIETVEILEAWEAPGAKPIKILQTKVMAHLYDCFYKNHPLYIDKKVHVLIPFLNANIDDGAVLAAEVIKVLSIKDPNSTSESQHMAFSSAKDVDMGRSQMNQLINRFKVLKNDHHSSTKVCKHCILVHKKSHMMLNVFVGSPGKSNYLAGTPFENLNDTSLYFKPLFSGLTIKLVHSLDKSDQKLAHTLMELPFFSITRDQGFFKDNIMVHCTETRNAKPGENLSEESLPMLKLKPLLKTVEGPIDYFDEKFWRYFKQFEKFLKSNEGHESFDLPNIPLSKKDDRLASSKAFRFGGMGESLAPSKEPQIYILFARKKVLKKSILRHFNVSGEEDLKNFTTLKLNKLVLEFSSLKSFLTWRYTINSIVYVNTWLEHYVYTNFDRAEKARRASTKNPSKYMTQESIDQAVLGEDLSFGINQLGILVTESLSKEPTSLWIDQIQFNTSAKNYVESHKNRRRANKPWEVFSIDNIDMQMTSESRLNIGKTKLIYDKAQEKLAFSIKSIEYENLNKKDQPLLQSEKSKTGSKNFFEATLQFKQSLLDRVKLTISPIKLNITTNVLAKELGAISLSTNQVSQHLLRLSQVLVQEVFREHVFKEVEQSLNQEKLKRQAHSPIKDNEVSHLGTFAATQDYEVNVVLESLCVKCLVDDTVLFDIDAGEIHYAQSEQEPYKVDIENLSIIPYDSYYKNFITHMSPAHRLQIRVEKSHTSPVVKIKNAKIIYLSRMITELKEFQKAVEKNISMNAQKLADTESLKLAPQPAETKKAELDTGKKSVMKLEFENSCVVMPRSSHSKDVFIALFDKLEAFIDKETKLLDIPEKLNGHFTDIGGKKIISKNEQWEKINWPVMVVNAELSKVNAMYVVGHRKINIGNLKKFIISFISASTRLERDDWVFDSEIKVAFKDFNMPMNLTCLTELDVLTSENLRETSKLFEPRPKNLQKTRIDLFGKKGISARVDQALIPGTIARELLAQKQPQKEMNNNEDFVDFLNRTTPSKK